MTTLLEYKHVTKRFPGVIALNDVSFDLRAGEIHSLCGENGAGKSTLIKVLSGIYPSDSYDGDILLNGQVTNFTGIADSAVAGVAVIYQELALIPDMTVAENIFLGAEPTTGGFVNWHELYKRTANLLDDFGLNLDPAARVGDLGIGQQQLVEIVKALKSDSKLLLLDEPTAALTESEVDILLEIIKGLKQKGITCIYVSHKLDEVFSISDRITVLRDGKSIITLEAEETDKHAIICHMVGREIEDLFPRRQSHVGETVLSVENLSVRNPETGGTVLRDINFELKKGEVLGIGGLMGAGRTELLMHIFGAFGVRESGTVMYLGEELHHTPPEVIKKGIALLNEDRKRFGLILDHSIGFNLSLSSLERISKKGFIDENKEFKENESYFNSLSIKAQGQETVVQTLSGGNQQKVVLGKALMTNPEIVFLDEPTRGIDVGAKVEIYELINALTEEGKAVVVVSSELPELMGISDRMIVLYEGTVGGMFSSSEATQEKIMAAAMGQKIQDTTHE